MSLHQSEPTRVGTPLSFGDPAHHAAHQFLVEEAHVLDSRDLDGWLRMLCHDVTYRAPVRVTTARGAAFDELETASHFDEDYYSLRKRVERFSTEHAWTEDPPSRTRHFVSNVRCFHVDEPGLLAVDSYLLLFRSRGDVRPPDLVSAGRHDLLRGDPEVGYQLARRRITLDESVLRTQNLAVFL
ncbi:3-phenylpropionate/cinnamic acid dioxygenase subunit beta [Amycolatopsis acidiphila]|uniref:3-phenylpropionate/cinnamic acid dioxygenase subunit beta n=2 Tax=Amycolatopsis acidiphila TaxID=715473 RepID=A0A558ANS8_9PSEU|nr:3-phenylpropionate/cinnamic acid dioxygenase subunit beta [Amycolatopsis acidiphila]TVT25917.1 3-phenylpropionate/cinnamic acid dioxygenase subunit beta [Amycolatopsis acidiphila]UIJ63377.1 3-phenylpropionate/cinnamic acid dioxygenase subunit beta [Amycolatopsis acidiphila]GHG75263.1 hypothetical biphenyl dioxygenase beta subunit [Amycolatopsis acidiphila]